jgi:hypothetical protein
MVALIAMPPAYQATERMMMGRGQRDELAESAAPVVDAGRE